MSSSSASTDLPRIPKGKHLRGEELADFERLVVAHYETNQASSIRSICRDTGRSYGAIHQILLGHDVTLRERGSRGRKQRLAEAHRSVGAAS